MTAANPFLAPKPRPLVTGHRGVPLVEQENTMAAFHRARSLGVPAIELDVMVTRDEQVVCFHDDDTSRLTGETGSIRKRTWDQISRLRVQSRLCMGVDADGRDLWIDYPRPQPIPLLAEVLDEFAGKLAINIEIKPSSPTWSQRGDGSIVGEVIREAGAEDSVIVTSFDFFKLNALEKTHAALHSGFTYDDGMFRSLLDWLMFFPELRSQVTAVEGNQNPEALLNLVMESNAVGRWIGSTVIGVEHTLLDDDSVSRLRARGSQAVGTYTLLPLDVRTVRQIARANSPAEVERLVALGVDWIETDDPERLLELVAR